jgi:hypothetical protein
VVCSIISRICSRLSPSCARARRRPVPRLEFLLGGDDEVVCRALDLGHDRRDLGGGVDDRLGELADLDGDDREALPGLARARRLDGGVEREDLGLVGDAVDDREHLADLLAALAEREDLASPRTGCGS